MKIELDFVPDLFIYFNFYEHIPSDFKQWSVGFMWGDRSILDVCGKYILDRIIEKNSCGSVLVAIRKGDLKVKIFDCGILNEEG